MSKVIFSILSPAKTIFRFKYLFCCIVSLVFALYADNADKKTFTDTLSNQYENQAKADVEENRFQNEINNLFGDIDTTGWLINRINGWCFDYSSLNDTLRIPFIDSLHKRYFTFPFNNYTTSPFGPRRNFWHFGQD
ncbi:MAG: hypothetical protein Q4F84_09885, partial [Fibrobacter sp.]|nr:hypothetical protein [Fibrobacter sp.]